MVETGVCLARSELIFWGQKSGKSRRADTLSMVDCLALWLSPLLKPLKPAEFIENKPLEQHQQAKLATLLVAITAVPGLLVLIGNETGLGLLSQQVSKACQRVTLMATGLPLTLKDAA